MAIAVIEGKGNFVSMITLNYKLLRSTGIKRESRNLSIELTPPVEVFSSRKVKQARRYSACNSQGKCFDFFRLLGEVMCVEGAFTAS
jgi:hypothetical protein